MIELRQTGIKTRFKAWRWFPSGRRWIVGNPKIVRTSIRRHRGSHGMNLDRVLLGVKGELKTSEGQRRNARRTMIVGRESRGFHGFDLPRTTAKQRGPGVENNAWGALNRSVVVLVSSSSEFDEIAVGNSPGKQVIAGQNIEKRVVHTQFLFRNTPNMGWVELPYMIEITILPLLLEALSSFVTTPFRIWFSPASS